VPLSLFLHYVFEINQEKDYEGESI
jgi:hypothetical protein